MWIYFENRLSSQSLGKIQFDKSQPQHPALFIFHELEMLLPIGPSL